MPPCGHNCRPKSHPRRNLEREGAGGQRVPRNLTFPEMQSSPKNGPTPECKIADGGQGNLCSTKALQDTRNRQHSFFNCPRKKPHASARRENRKHWLQQQRRGVGRLSHKVRAQASGGENANLQGQAEWPGVGGQRNTHSPTCAMEQRILPSTHKQPRRRAGEGKRR